VRRNPERNERPKTMKMHLTSLFSVLAAAALTAACGSDPSIMQKGVKSSFQTRLIKTEAQKQAACGISILGDVRPLSAMCSDELKKTRMTEKTSLEDLLLHVQDSLTYYNPVQFDPYIAYLDRDRKKFHFSNKAKGAVAWIADMVRRDPAKGREAFNGLRPFLFVEASNSCVIGEGVASIAYWSKDTELRMAAADALLERLGRKDLSSCGGFRGAFEDLIDEDEQVASHLMGRKDTPAETMEYAGTKYQFPSL
jgi:hypothetical protein